MSAHRQWSALVIGVALVAWPAFQAVYGRPQLSFAFDRVGDHSGCVLQVHIRNQPVESAFLLQLGVGRDDANFSLSMLVFDGRGNEILRYPEETRRSRLRLTASFAQHKPAAQRMFVVTQRKLDSYWADA